MSVLAGLHRPRQVVVDAFTDGPGRLGTSSLARPRVRVFADPEDANARAWKQTGTSARDVRLAIDADKVITLEVRRG